MKRTLAGGRDSKPLLKYEDINSSEYQDRNTDRPSGPPVHPEPALDVGSADSLQINHERLLIPGDQNIFDATVVKVGQDREPENARYVRLYTNGSNINE